MTTSVRMSLPAQATAEFETLAETEHWGVFRCDRHRVLMLRRTPKPVRDAAEMRASWEPIYEATKELPLHAWGLCLDMRLATPTQDPAVEQTLRQCREKLSSQTRCYAALLKSAAGALHATRLVQPAKFSNVRVFRDDEMGALQFLIEQLGAA